MAVSIFLSRAAPHLKRQEAFLATLCSRLTDRGLEPRTVGETDFGARPLEEIRGVMMECSGLISVAFRRMVIHKGEDRPHREFKDLTVTKVPPKTWLTTPYCHIEAAMAFQLGLPILILLEKDVRQEGALEPGVIVLQPPSFDTATDPRGKKFFKTVKWRALAATWEGQVREVARNKRRPPVLYTT